MMFKRTRAGRTGALLFLAAALAAGAAGCAEGGAGPDDRATVATQDAPPPATAGDASPAPDTPPPSDAPARPPADLVPPRMSDPLPPRRVPGPVALDRSCRTDADCTIKDVGNCCGAYPSCVNVDSPTDPDAVQAQCAAEGMASVCGFPAVTGCSCVEGQCRDVTASVPAAE